MMTPLWRKPGDEVSRHTGGKVRGWGSRGENAAGRYGAEK